MKRAGRKSETSKRRTKPTVGGAPHIVSPDDRADAGKTLRDKLAREEQGRWKPSKDRPNPIGLLRKSDSSRVKDLVPIRYGRMWVLARAHAKVSEISATISGYLGSSSDEFDQAMGRFAIAHADQAERDHAALKAAGKKGKIKVYLES